MLPSRLYCPAQTHPLQITGPGLEATDRREAFAFPCLRLEFLLALGFVPFHFSSARGRHLSCRWPVHCFSGMAAFLLPSCMWFCSGSFCFQSRHFLSRAAVVEVFCGSWWHLALVAVRRSRDVLMWGYSLLPATATQTASTPRTHIKPRIHC